MRSAVCTVFEGQYHYGLAALANSLWRSGFRGRIYAGYRGALPPWARNVRRVNDADTEFQVTADLAIEFISLSTELHLSSYKPTLLKQIAERVPEAELLFYFDTDIVLYCKWAFFEQWAADGVALCADVNWSMPNSHPIRSAWRRHYATKGFSLPRAHEHYYNAGFIGLNRASLGFLSEWQSLLDLTEANCRLISEGDRTNPFRIPDQDSLNAATMLSSCIISTLGPDGMDFQPGGGGFAMGHAVGPRKPWSKSLLLSAIRGARVPRVTMSYLRNIRGPIHPYSTLGYYVKRADALAAKAVGRLLT